MSKKAAVELTANFLVVIIIAIVVFTMGIILTYNIVNKINSMQKDLDDKTKEEIINLLDSGRPVVAPINTAEVKRGKTYTFGIGVNNIIGYPSDFDVNVDGSTVDGCNSETFSVLISNQKRQIPANGKEVFNIVITAPKNAQKCIYVFNVMVKSCTPPMQSCTTPDKPYQTAQKLYVTVP